MLFPLYLNCRILHRLVPYVDDVLTGAAAAGDASCAPSGDDVTALMAFVHTRLPQNDPRIAQATRTALNKLLLKARAHSLLASFRQAKATTTTTITGL
jgi:hypothetical protein